MPYFRYQALNADQQTIAGELEAASVAVAVVQLESHGLIVQSIGFARREGNGTMPVITAPAASGARIELIPFDTDRAELERHLQRVIDRTRPLLAPLDSYAKELPGGAARRQLAAVLQTIGEGNAAQAALAAEMRPTFWVPLLSAAAASSQPGDVLEKFIAESQQALQLRRQWWLTLAYPGFVACFAAGILIFLSLVPIPIFRNVFQGFGLRLPALTQFVLSVAAWIENGAMLGVLLAAAAAVFLLWQSTKLLPAGIRQWIDDRWGAPLGRSTALARFTQFLGDLLAADIETPTALRIAGLTSKSQRLGRSARRLASDLEAQREIDDPAYRGTISMGVLYAIRSNLSLPSRARLLHVLSRCHAKRSAVALSWTRGAMEPLLSLVLGIIVGVVVVALFLPLLNLIQGLS